MRSSLSCQLNGQVAVIAGAASGIGLATLRLFVENGARVVAADVQEDMGRTLEADFPGAVIFARCDVTVPQQIKSAIDLAANRFGGLDILSSNAGRGSSTAGVEDSELECWDSTQALLLRSVAAGAAWATPHMKARGGGSLINTASVSALQAGYAPICYSVAEAGVLHFSRLAAAESPIPSGAPDCLPTLRRRRCFWPPMLRVLWPERI